MTLTIKTCQFYPEEFRRKTDAEKYRDKGTCEVSIEINSIEMAIKNITYRIDHSGKIHLKPPYRIHSNKKAGIKPKLVPSVVFKNAEIWLQIERHIKKELENLETEECHKSSKASKPAQLSFWDMADLCTTWQ